MSNLPRNKPLLALLKDEFTIAKGLIQPFVKNELEEHSPIFWMQHHFLNSMSSIQSVISVGRTVETMRKECKTLFHDIAFPLEGIKELHGADDTVELNSAFHECQLDLLASVARIKSIIDSNVDLAEIHPGMD